MIYKIIFSPHSERQLDKLESVDRVKIFRRIVRLEGSPRPPGCKKLKSFKDLYRMRVGEFRVVYRILDSSLEIHIMKVDRRGRRTYKNLLL